MNEFARLGALAKRLRETYKRGTRIVLNHMGSDPRPIPDGSRGTVVGVDDIGSIMVKWDCGRGLSLIYGEDSFRPLTQEEIAEESAPKKTREFIGRLNRDVFPQVSTEKLQAFEDTGDTWYVKSILKAMHETFCEVYDGDYIDGDTEYVTVPAVIKGANGKLYAGLVDLDVASSGEHCGSSILTPLGMIEHDGSNLTSEQDELLRKIIPYEYWYTPYIESDHHVDFENIPPEAEEVLSYQNASFAKGTDLCQNPLQRLQICKRMQVSVVCQYGKGSRGY